MIFSFSLLIFIFGTKIPSFSTPTNLYTPFTLSFEAAMLSPQPIESMTAPWANKSLILYSSSPFDKQIFVSLYPCSSNIFLASLERYAKSPESILIPLNG